MLVETSSIIPISEANQNFSRVARLVDEKGRIVIMRNNAPAYVLSSYQDADDTVAIPDEMMMSAARSIMDRYHDAFAELAK